MNHSLIAFTGAACLVALTVGVLAESPSYSKTYEKYVQSDGTIMVPQDYRTKFTFIGTFSVAGGDQSGGQAQFHQVYLDPDSVEHYRRTREFPDGAILIKELQKTRATKMTTGHASFWDDDAGWFVMIKDTKDRFKDSGLWGDGWGWALFDASDRTKPTTKNYKAECIACHVPSRKTDWVHVWAYPSLEAKDRFKDFNP
ncbi:MAG: cytochrome P460 family protein [Methylococcales bacterium]|nr:cytochrome P460 family protein [Methylococcales bacterium]